MLLHFSFAVTEVIQCTIPKCDQGCQLNYDAEPCPVCECEKSEYKF